MIDPSKPVTQNGMSLPAAMGRWALCVAVVLLVFALFGQGPEPIGGLIMAIIAYISCGVYLNRKVLPRLVDFHPVYNTLNNVTRDKLNMFKLWPISYPKLFFHLWIDKTI